MFTDIFKNLTPPAKGAAHEKVTYWRWWVFAILMALLVNSMVGRGLVYGFPAYAMAADVEELLELQLVQTITNLHTTFCMAEGQNRITIANTIEDYQRRYLELTGSRVPLIPCDVLLGSP